MRVIPVLDLLNGLAVHAVKGERAHYKPVKSVLCNSSDPIQIANAFRETFEAKELYLADLDAIQSFGQTNHREILSAIVREGIADILLDAGICDLSGINSWLKLGMRKVIIGSETLRSWKSIQEIPAFTDPSQLIFSLDLQDGEIFSRCPVLSQMPPLEILDYAQAAGWQEAILLDLKRVGSSRGAEHSLAMAVRKRLPDLKLLIGGGINGPNELSELEAMGVNGALLATALHNGTIRFEHIHKYRHSGS